MSLKELFSERLGLAIKGKGIRKIDLAQIIGVRPSAISQLLSAASLPSVETLTQIADALGVSTDYLTGRTDELTVALSEAPEGILPYYVNLSGTPIHGSFKYIFGVFPTESRKFIILDDLPGGTFMSPGILRNPSESGFLTLVCLLNWKLGFNYNPFNPGKMDILIHLESSDGSKYQGISLGNLGIGVKVYSISREYSAYLEEYLSKTTSLKAAYLKIISFSGINSTD